MNFSTIERKNTCIKIAYETLGNTSAEPFLFLHGLGAGRAQTTRAFTELSGHLVIAPDMLGHGDSVSADADCVLSFDQFADDSIAILDEMGIDKVNLGGLSMGSGISINIALRYPKRVKKLVLLRPCWMSEKQPQHLRLVAWVGQWIKQVGVEDARSRLYDHPVYRELDQRLPKVAVSLDNLFRRPQIFSHTAVLYRMWQDSPFEDIESLSRIENQSIVLCSPRDELHPIPVAKKIAGKMPNCQLHTLPPRYDKPLEYNAELNRSVVEFLG